MHTLASDIRYAVRNLLNARGFAVVAMATLALGIGAPVAMFSVVNALLLRPLPFPDPDRLVALGQYDTRKQDQRRDGQMAFPDIADVRERNRSFASVAAYRDGEYTATGLGQPLHVEVSLVSAGFFRVLDVQSALGRTFRADEDVPGRHVVILSDAFWRAHFNADPGVLGRPVTLGGRIFTVVGVAPRGFQFPIRTKQRDMWLTLSRDAEADDPKDRPINAQRGADLYQAIARLKPGVTLPQANADLASIANSLRASYADTNSYVGFAATPEIESLIGRTRGPLLVLFGAVGLVLLIACANVANLLLGRGGARSREMAIRAALGATRGRIVRQLITESVVLSLAGAALGIGFATWALSAVLRLYPANLPRAEQIDIDMRVVLFTTALALLTALAFGLLPALRSASANPAASMREGGRAMTSGRGHNRLRSGLVVAETALGVTLLIGAGLLLRSLDRLSRAPLGFDPDHVLTASFDLSDIRYNSDQMDRFVGELLRRVRALPGVVDAGGSAQLPLASDYWIITFNQLDHPLPEASQPVAGFYVVTSRFFETMHIPVMRGRLFDDRDQRNSAPVMIVNQAFARKYYPNEDAIGHRVEIGAGEGAARRAYKTRTIIGVIGDIRSSNLSAEPAPAYYIPLPQLMFGPPTLVIRTAGDPRAMSSPLRRVLSSMDPEAPLYDVRPLEDYLALDLGRARFQTALLGLFAGIALLLTAIGLYGVIAHGVSQRTHEIGIRMALGASRSEVLRMVLQHGMALTFAGMAAGVLGAAAVARLIEASLYQTPPRDPLTYITVCILLSAVALLASYAPALRATRVDPMAALRSE